MSLALLRFLAMTVGPSITAAARPAVTFLAVQVVVAIMVAQDVAALPAALEWLVSVPAIVVAAVLAGLETAAKHDPDIAAVLRDLQVDNLTGAFGAFTAALLFAALGMPEADATALVDGAPVPVGDDGGVLDATAAAASSDLGTPVQVGAVGAAVGINLGLTWLRSQLLAFVDDFDLGRLWARIETGGVVGVLILLPLLPLIIFSFLVFFALALAAGALAARAAQRAMDRRARVECDSCGYAVRKEASLCPECKTAREPAMGHASGVSAALSALKSRTSSAPTTT